MAKLGLSFEELQAVNPSIIMLSLPAFGCSWPLVWLSRLWLNRRARRGAASFDR